jgi:histidinol dehydrogenase
MLAGPSEVLVLGDDAADPAGAAADILAQTEHDPLCSAAVVTPSAAFADRVLEEIARQTADLPRADIVRRALDANGFVVCTRSLEEAADVASLYAPEHLHLDVREPWALLGRIENAGAILVGRHVSATLGDYLAGPSHTLPTAGCARFSSPLNVDDFLKKTSVLYFSGEAADNLAGAAAVFARFEGLEAHVRAAAAPRRA